MARSGIERARTRIEAGARWRLAVIARQGALVEYHAARWSTHWRARYLLAQLRVIGQVHGTPAACLASMTVAPTDHRSHLRALADALPPGSAVPVPREWLLALLDSPARAAVPDLLADRWLTATQVAELLATPARWVYNHADQLGGRRLSRRCLRFSEAAVRRYLERRR